jgi:ferredoxin-NADP reductase
MNWQIATLVSSQMVASDIKSLVFRPSKPFSFQAGQHCDLRLTSPEGYQAQRSYSIMSAPQDSSTIEFGVQILDGGEVSPFLYAMKPDDQLEIKGPLGGHFIWDHSFPGPLVLIGGGSGMVPLLSIYRHFHSQPDPRPFKFIVSAKSEDKIINYQELKEKLITRITSTQGHINAPFLSTHLASLLGLMPMIYVCGPTAFVENISNQLLELGFNPHLIRTERFG